MLEKMRPLHDKVLVKRLENQEQTAGGIIIPGTAQEKGQTGQVLAVGNGRLAKDGVTTLPLQVKAGDKVFFGKYAGTEAGSDLIVLREEDILGVIDQ